MTRTLCLALALVAAALPALAQVELPPGDFTSGLIRPFSGLGHFFALVAVGLLAAQRGGRALWELPAAFLGAALVGYVLGLIGIPLPFARFVIPASVVLLGVLIALGYRLSDLNTVIVVAIFGVFHGSLQGLAVRQSDAVSTGIGFVVAATVIYAVAVIGGVALLKTLAKAKSGSYLSWAGWGIAAIGVVLFFVG